MRPAAITRMLRRLAGEDAGQMTIEWALVMVVVALPFLVLFRLLVKIIVAHFQMVTFMQSLPFP